MLNASEGWQTDMQSMICFFFFFPPDNFSLPLKCNQIWVELNGSIAQKGEGKKTLELALRFAS